MSETVIARMRSIEGWLREREARLLMAGASRALSELPGGAVVEVGSYAGRSTYVLASVVKALASDARVYAVDPHEGRLTTTHGAPLRVAPTLETFRQTIRETRIEDVVEPIVARSTDWPWGRPIAFLYIDGMHDMDSVRADFTHFEPCLLPRAYVAFHDYRANAPDVEAFVDSLVETGGLAWVERAEGLALLRRPG